MYGLLLAPLLLYNSNTTSILLKEKANPAEIKVGIASLKALRDGRVLTVVNSGTEINLLGDKIWKECAETIAVNMQTIRKPKMIILTL
jgi:hypothetical protein